MYLLPLTIIKIANSNYKTILDTIETFSQLALTGIAGTWLAISQLNLGKRKEKREINKETANKANQFINLIYLPFRNISTKINNLKLLNKQKNELFNTNKNIVNTSYTNLPKILQKCIKQNLYASIVKYQATQLLSWSKNFSNYNTNKNKLIQSIGNDYIWIINTYKSDLDRINNNHKLDLCYNIYREIERYKKKE